MKKIIIFACIVNLLILIANIIFAIAVPDNNDTHPNITAALRLVKRAYAKILDAQKAEEFDAEGHAQKAMNLLGQVKTEMKLAEQTVNINLQEK